MAQYDTRDYEVFWEETVTYRAVVRNAESKEHAIIAVRTCEYDDIEVIESEIIDGSMDVFALVI